jgi:OTU domain-containing protein 6
MYTHVDDFLPFLPSVDGEDGIGATDPGFMTPAQFETYCATIRDTGVWGGEPEILALCRAFNIPIHVIQTGKPPIVVHNPRGDPTADGYSDKKTVRISYHRRMYGLGEVSSSQTSDFRCLIFTYKHYNSLRPKPGFMKSLLETVTPS